MNRQQWSSVYRSARLDRRRDPVLAARDAAASFETPARSFELRKSAAWAVTLVAVLGAALAFWHIAPSDQRGEGIAVSVPAASTPAAAEGPSSAHS